MNALSPNEVQERLASLPGWRYEGFKLVRQFKFANFVEAFGFMTRVALAAEAMNHHPQWTNSYGTVDIALATEDVDGITGLDFELARRIDALHLQQRPA